MEKKLFGHCGTLQPVVEDSGILVKTKAGAAARIITLFYRVLSLAPFHGHLLAYTVCLLIIAYGLLIFNLPDSLIG